MPDNPHVRFELNKDLDTWTATEFEVGTVSEVNSFYRSNSSELKQFIHSAQTEWDEVADDFFKITAELFHDYPWPKGKYIGYASIFDCNPRFLDSKTFQTYYGHRAGSNYATAHELLHFIFYEYAAEKFPELFNDKDTESGIFWDVAEIFNAIILETPDYFNIHYYSDALYYPEHEVYIESLRGVWEDNPNIDEFIPAIYEKVSGMPDIDK